MQIVRVLQTAAVSLLAALAALQAQALQLEPNRPQHPAVPTVTFAFDWASIEPHRYIISVDSSGNAAYQSWTADPTARQSVADDAYQLRFTMSAAARDRIFGLARQLKYFDSDFEYHKHRVAFTGEKTLAYADPDKQYETRYNWSENSGINELTALFQGMSPTIESGRRLERLHRFERLGLDQELKNLELLVAEHQATELQLIVPVLERVAGDPAVLNIARQRARHILQVAGAPPSPGTEASQR